MNKNIKSIYLEALLPGGKVIFKRENLFITCRNKTIRDGYNVWSIENGYIEHQLRSGFWIHVTKYVFEELGVDIWKKD